MAAEGSGCTEAVGVDVGVEAAARLRELGYAYVPGPSRTKSDWVLRQRIPAGYGDKIEGDGCIFEEEDPSFEDKGFAWNGQARTLI